MERLKNNFPILTVDGRYIQGATRTRGRELIEQEATEITEVIIRYKQFRREEPLRFDVLVDSCLFVEVKAMEEVLPIHKAQLLSYMKLLDIPLGLIINFHTLKLTDGVSRLILPGANLE